MKQFHSKSLIMASSDEERFRLVYTFNYECFLSIDYNRWRLLLFLFNSKQKIDDVTIP